MNDQLKLNTIAELCRFNLLLHLLCHAGSEN